MQEPSVEATEVPNDVKTLRSNKGWKQANNSNAGNANSRSREKQNILLDFRERRWAPIPVGLLVVVVLPSTASSCLSTTPGT
eukprot:6153218-Amphidinium_carterae.1